MAYGNAGDGVHIESGGSKTTSAADANFIGGIDLGGAAGGSAGGNVLQTPYGAVAGYNRGAGICLAIAPTAGQVLSALGNTLVTVADAAVDCSATTGTVVKSSACRSGAGAPASIGVTPAEANTNSIDIATCN